MSNLKSLKRLTEEKPKSSKIRKEILKEAIEEMNKNYGRSETPLFWRMCRCTDKNFPGFENPIKEMASNPELFDEAINCKDFNLQLTNLIASQRFAALKIIINSPLLIHYILKKEPKAFYEAKIHVANTSPKNFVLRLAETAQFDLIVDLLNSPTYDSREDVFGIKNTHTYEDKDLVYFMFVACPPDLYAKIFLLMKYEHMNHILRKFTCDKQTLKLFESDFPFQLEVFTTLMNKFCKDPEALKIQLAKSFPDLFISEIILFYEKHGREKLINSPIKGKAYDDFMKYHCAIKQGKITLEETSFEDFCETLIHTIELDGFLPSRFADDAVAISLFKK